MVYNQIIESLAVFLFVLGIFLGRKLAEILGWSNQCCYPLMGVMLGIAEELLGKRILIINHAYSQVLNCKQNTDKLAVYKQ